MPDDGLFLRQNVTPCKTPTVPEKPDTTTSPPNLTPENKNVLKDVKMCTAIFSEFTIQQTKAVSSDAYRHDQAYMGWSGILSSNPKPPCHSRLALPAFTILGSGGRVGYRRRCVNVCMNGSMLGNFVKCFEWPLVRKAQYKCSPFTIYTMLLPRWERHSND